MSSQRPTFGVISLEQHVAAEQPAAVPAEQCDVAVRVAGQHEHVERLAGEVERVALVHEVRRLDGHERNCVLVADRALGEVRRHAVSHQVALEARAGLGIEPGGHGQLAVAPALHDLLGAGELGQSRARADVVGVVVRDHEAAHVRVPELRERLLPAPPGARRAEPAVDQRPALRVVDRVAVDVVERPRQRLRDAVHAVAQLPHLELAPRAAAQGAVRP